MRPLIDPDRNGVQGGFYSYAPSHPFAMEHTLTVDMSDRLRATFDEGLQSLNRDYLSDTFLRSGVVRAVSARGWDKIPPVRDGALRALGVFDALSLATIEPDGSGCILASFRSELVVLKSAEADLLRGIFRHFSAAHRLQRRLQGQVSSPDLAAAVLDPNGHLHHAQGATTDPAFREGLHRAVLGSEEARGRRRRRDPHGAISAWESLVMGRWTFVDHFDHDGRRYILALENAPKPAGLERLSAREREVVQRALLGSHNKLIAYELGVSHSTVKVLMSRAAAKLGVRTREELLAKVGASVG